MRVLASLLSRQLLFILAAASCVLPLGVLAFYSHPALDDFAIGHYLRSRTMGQYVLSTYIHNSGRYSSSLFSAVLKFFGTHPQAYQLLIFGGLLSFVLSLYAVASSVTSRGQEARILGSLLTIAALVNFPWPAEGIFWLTGLIAYLYPVILTALLAALLSWLYAHPQRPHRVLWVIALLLGFIIPGFSEITALLLPLVYLGVAVALRISVRRWSWGGVGAAILLGSLLTLGSPAHFARWQALGPGHGVAGLVKGLLLATGGATYCVVNWLGNGMLLILVLLGLPLTSKLAPGPTQPSLLHRLTRQPWLWPLLTLVGVWLAFLFCHVASGIAPALRVKNLLYLYFVAGGLLSAYSWASRLNARYMALLVARPVQALLVGWFAVAFLSDHNVHLTHDDIGRESNTVVQAYRDWLSGSAARYDQQQRTRVALLRTASPGSAPLRLDPLLEQPRTIFYYDISADERLWGNVAYSQFYGGPAVYVLKAGEPR
ncbi:DUF6056 family protein [Hymenobacter setariae]|uniref:DUF6056 family protein n=1 Tax=Hymenobacter setariae TaxID=2594794 RepID=UPI001F327900|nr:DUF6056 family protein [Hymenobacter setariae]